MDCGLEAWDWPLTVEPSKDSNAFCLSAGGWLFDVTDEPEPWVTEERGVAGAELFDGWTGCWVLNGFMLEDVAGGVVSDWADDCGLILRKRESSELGGDDGAGSR